MSSSSRASTISGITSMPACRCARASPLHDISRASPRGEYPTIARCMQCSRVFSLVFVRFAESSASIPLRLGLRSPRCALAPRRGARPKTADAHAPTCLAPARRTCASSTRAAAAHRGPSARCIIAFRPRCVCERKFVCFLRIIYPPCSRFGGLCILSFLVSGVQQDDARYGNGAIDIFGRERHMDERDDMGGVGSMMREGKVLYIGRLSVRHRGNE